MSHDGITNHIDSEASESAERRRLLSLAARAGDHATYEELIGFERILAKSRVLSRARIESKTFGGHARRPTAVRILVVDNGRRKSRLVEKVKFKSSARLRRRRSEERRVGKECRSGWEPNAEKRKTWLQQGHADVYGCVV